MTNYCEMYHILFNKITDIIEELQEIQHRMEEMYIQVQNSETAFLEACNNDRTKALANAMKSRKKR